MKIAKIVILLIFLPLPIIAQEQPGIELVAMSPVEFETLEERVNEIKNDAEKKQAFSDGQISALRQKLDELDASLELARNSASSVPELQQALRQTIERIDVLEQINKKRDAASLVTLRASYDTGKEVLNSIIRNTGKLSAGIDLSSIMSDHQSILNPMKDHEFAKDINLLSSKAKRSNSELINKIVATGLIQNPYISGALSIASFLVSGDKPQERLTRFQNIGCVVTFTTDISPDLRTVERDLSALKARIDTFQGGAKRRFGLYASVVGYDKNWDAYVDERQKGVDPLVNLTDETFKKLSSDSSKNRPPLIIKLHIENAKLTVIEYERLLTDVDDFFGAYLTAVEKSTKRQMEDSCSTSSVPKIQKQLEALASRLRSNRENTRASYLDDIPAPTKAVLFEF